MRELFRTCGAGASYEQVNACELDLRYKDFYEELRAKNVDTNGISVIKFGEAGDCTKIDVASFIRCRRLSVGPSMPTAGE